MTASLCLCYIPCPDEATAQNLAARLLDEKLIACANLYPIQSVYRWEGAVQNDREWVLLGKTRSELYAELCAFVENAHPYDTPCVLQLPAAANAAFGLWVQEETKEPKNQ